MPCTDMNSACANASTGTLRCWTLAEPAGVLMAIDLGQDGDWCRARRVPNAAYPPWAAQAIDVSLAGRAPEMRFAHPSWSGHGRNICAPTSPSRVANREDTNGHQSPYC